MQLIKTISSMQFKKFKNNKFIDSDSNCSLSEYMCKTGVCISKWKRCNMAKDCYHGDDEEHCGTFEN